jgi:hypothetical protein
MSIRVHVDRLILDGVPVGFANRGAVKAIVGAELARLLTEKGLSAGLVAGGAVPSLSAGSIELPKKMTPGGLGAQIARAVHGSLSR